MTIDFFFFTQCNLVSIISITHFYVCIVLLVIINPRFYNIILYYYNICIKCYVTYTFFFLFLRAFNQFRVLYVYYIILNHPQQQCEILALNIRRPWYKIGFGDLWPADCSSLLYNIIPVNNSCYSSGCQWKLDLPSEWNLLKKKHCHTRV